MRPPQAGRAVLLLLLAFAAGAGCRPADGGGGRIGLPQGSSDQVVTAEGKERSYRVYVPASLPSERPAALVVMLHGGFGSGAQAEDSYGWNAEADRGQFVVAYPDGLSRAWAVGGGCCGAPGREGVDDVAFIEAVVVDLSTSLRIDPARVYATGMSNGGMLSYRLACDSTLFAAIAPVSGTLLGDCPQPRRIALMHIHGLADRNVAFDGSRGEGAAAIDGPPIESIVDFWRGVDGCAPPTTRVEREVTIAESACGDGTSVELITLADAGHQWPGARDTPVADRVLGLDPPSKALNATETIWQFFMAHPRPA